MSKELPLFSTSFCVLLGQLEGSVRFALGFLPGVLGSRFFCLFLHENAYLHRNPGGEKHISSAMSQWFSHSSVCVIITQTDRAVAAGELAAWRLPGSSRYHRHRPRSLRPPLAVEKNG